MCLIATSNSKSKIPLNLLENAYENNKDGVGIVYHNPATDRLEIVKSAGKFDDFKAIWDAAPDNVNIAVHFRFKTHGEISLDNIHPYEILSKDKGHEVDLVMMHNGTISSIHQTGEKRSDTAMYIDLVLRPILAENPALIHNTGFLKLVTRDIGSYNKFLFFNSKNEVVIFNKDSGHEEKDVPDVWFSNSYSIKTSTYRSSKTSTGPSYFDTASNWAKNRSYGHNTYNSDSFSSVSLVPMFNTEAEKKAIEELNRYLDKDEVLLSRTNKIAKKTIGYGWVLKGGKSYTYYPNIAAMHIELDDARAEAKKAEKKKEKEVSPIITAPAQIVFDLERKHTLRDLAVYTKAETLEWVVNYPERAAELLIQRGFGGGKLSVEQYVNSNVDATVDAIYNLAHYNSFASPFGDYMDYSNIAM